MSSTSSPKQAPSPKNSLDLSAIWPPLATFCPHSPTERQAAFLLLDQQEAFYGGAAGGGKSDALLMAALQYVDKPGYAALILRRTFAQLDLPGAIMARSKEWLTGKAHWNDDRKTWTFPGGATLTFGYLENDNDVYRYQGPEFQFVGYDELTQFSEKQYRYLFSRTRRLVDSHVPIRVRSASNPGGVGHAWVKRRFIDERKTGVVFIPAKLSDNPHLDQAEYETSLGELDEALRLQLLNGDWGAFEGAAFKITDQHLVDRFEMPTEFERFESMDYGLNNPTAWLAWAADYDGNLVCFDEYYQPGLPSETAPVILAKRADWRSQVCWGDPNSLAMRTGTTRSWGEHATVETLFADEGLFITRGNDNPRAGYAQLRELVKCDPARRFPLWHPQAGAPGAPRLFVVAADCPQLVEQLRTAPLQPIDKRHGGEMIDPVWESRHGHALAAARYGVLSRPDPSKEPKPDEDDRELHARRMLERASGANRLIQV